jgi:hypothetical protein
VTRVVSWPLPQRKARTVAAVQHAAVEEAQPREVHGQHGCGAHHEPARAGGIDGAAARGWRMRHRRSSRERGDRDVGRRAAGLRRQEERRGGVRVHAHECPLSRRQHMLRRKPLPRCTPGCPATERAQLRGRHAAAAARRVRAHSARHASVLGTRGWPAHVNNVLPLVPLSQGALTDGAHGGSRTSGNHRSMNTYRGGCRPRAPPFPRAPLRRPVLPPRAPRPQPRHPNPKQHASSSLALRSRRRATVV